MVTPLRLSSTLKHLSRSEASCGGCRLWSAADAADVPRAETFAVADLFVAVEKLVAGVVRKRKTR